MFSRRHFFGMLLAAPLLPKALLDMPPEKIPVAELEKVKVYSFNDCVGAVTTTKMSTSLREGASLSIDSDDNVFLGNQVIGKITCAPVPITDAGKYQIRVTIKIRDEFKDLFFI